jgi:hypothetical protein
MKLPGRVLDVVRGISGAALLCAAGCGAGPQQASLATTEEIALVQHQQHVPPKPEPAGEVEQWPEDEVPEDVNVNNWTYPDVHPACGRG